MRDTAPGTVARRYARLYGVEANTVHAAVEATLYVLDHRRPVEGSTPEDQLIDEVIADAGPREPLDDCPKPDPHGPHIVTLDAQAGVVQRCPGLRPPPEEVVHLQCSQQLEQAEKTAALHGYELGVEEGRRQAAQAIREETATFCMDGIGRHLVEVCTKLAAGPTHD